MALMNNLPAWQRWGDGVLAYSPRRGRHAVKGALASTIALVLALCLGPTLAAAGEPLQPDRPGQADPPTVLAPGVAHIEGGFTFLVNEDLQLDVSAGAGLNDAAPDFFVAAGVAWRLPRLWE